MGRTRHSRGRVQCPRHYGCDLGSFADHDLVWEAYCDEAYAILSNNYMNGKKQAPQGFSLQQLRADQADLK